jgi:hypothetical protein
MQTENSIVDCSIMGIFKRNINTAIVLAEGIGRRA